MTDLIDYNQYLVDLIRLNHVDLTIPGERDVYYGDQTAIPRVPSVCVDPGTERDELNGAPRRVRRELTSYVIVYHSKVSDNQTTRKQADQFAAALKDLILEEAQMGGLAIHSLVTAVESGYVERNKSLFRASRLTVEAETQVQLPSSV